MPTDTPTWDDTQPLAAEPTWDNTVPTWDNTQAIAEPTSNKLADAARRIPAGVQSGTGRTLAGAVRAGDIAATPTFIPFMGGLGPGAETINRLNQQMPAVREEFVRGRPQRLAESTAFQLGREIEQAAAPTFGVDPARDNEFLAQLATAAGEMVPTLAAGAVAGPAGVAFQYGTSAGESQAQEAIAAGKPEAADIAFLSAAGLGGITEAALGVPGRLLAIANRARKAGVNPGTFGRWANRNPMAAGIARAGAEGALREGAQEGLEQAGQNLIASDVAGYAPDRPVTEGVGRAMALGATLGGVIGGGSAGLNQAQRNERAALLRTLRDGRQVIVNEQTGTTDFPPLEGDELPPPPPPAPPADPANVPPPALSAPAPNLDPDPALQTLSPTPSAPTTATRGPTGAPAPVADVPRAGESLSPAAPSTFNLQPSTLPDVPGVPPPLERQPYDTALRTRPEATMETRPAAPLGLQREPTVSPELADTIQALRQGYQQQLDVPAEARAQSAASSIATPSRFRPRQAVEFSQPLVGPSGASLVAYEWKWTPVEEVDNRGEERIRRISNWEEAQSSAETGRDIVHQFQVKLPDGTVRMVSAESVPVVLGFAKSGSGVKLPTLVNASKTLAQLQMKLALLEQQEASNTEAMAKAKALPLPPITSEPAVATVGEDAGKPYGTRFKMGTDSWVLQREPGSITEERLKTLVRSWQDARAKEFGWARPSERRVDLQNRIARQQKKLDAIVQSQPTPLDQSGGPSAQPAQAGTVGNSAIDAAIAALDAAKIKTQGIYTLPDLGLTVTLWNGSLDAAKLALRAGRSLAQAVEAGIDWLRAQGQRFDDARVRTALEQTVKADARIAATKARTVAGRTVGTSNPTTKRRSGEGTDPDHNVSLQRLRARNPEAYRKNALLLTRYPLVAREYPDLAERMRAIDSPYEAAEERYENAKEKLEEAKSKVEKALAGLLERKANSIKAAEVEAWMRSDPNSKLTVAVRNAQELVATRKAQRDEAADRRSERIDALAKSNRIFPLEDADRIYESYIKVVESNLEALIKLASTTWRDTARLWYDGANLIAQDFARQFGATLEQASAVLAVFSPQKDWFMNVALARRMMNIWQNDQNTRWSPEMTRQFIKRSGEPQPVEDKETGQFVTSPKLVSEWNPDGVKYDKGARPGPPDADGNTTWLNWDNDKAAKNLAEARELLKDLEGRTLAELKDPDLQARFIRMLSEVRDNPNYPKVTPDGQFGELMRNENGKVLKIAWGGYNTIEKAIAVMGSRLDLKSGQVLTSEADVISAALGAQHKVRSFYNNIVDPANTSGHVTMDTHAIAALLWMPLSGASPEVTQNFGGAGTMNAGELGIKGMYAANAEAYRRAAVAFSLLPREVQSITWEAVRMLFPAKWKADKTNVAKVRDLWEQYRRNELTIDQARNAVFQLVFGRDVAGAIADDSGVGSPSWTGAMGDSAPDSQAAQETNDARVVSEARGAWGPGSGRGAGSAGSVGGGGNPAAVVRPAAEGVVDSAIAALESAKVKPGGLYALPDLGLTVTLWNGTLTAAQVALRATRSLAQAVQAGVDWLRAQGQAFDEAKVRKALEQGLLQAPGIREHVGKRLLQEDFSPAAKAALEPLLRYEVKPDAQLFAEAAAVVEAIGPMEAEANYFGNPWGLPADAHVVLGFAIGNGLSTLEAQARAAGDTALADRIGRQNAEFQSQFVLQSTETARTLRAYRYFDLVGNLSPFTADLFARKVIEQASQKQKQRLKPTLDAARQQLTEINRAGINEAARTPEVQGAARTAINQAIEEEAQRKDTAVERAITLEVSNTLETLPSVVRKANAAVLGAWDKLSAGEQVRQQTGRAGQGLENSLWSAVKQRGGTVSTVSSVIAQVNRALHEQVNRALGITPQQFVNPTTYLMRLRDALGNAEVMSRIWEQTRAAVGANLAAIGEMERLLVRIEAEIAELEAEAKTPLAGGPEVTAKDAKLKAQQQAARDEMLKGRNANLADAIKQRRDRIADVTAQLAEYRKMQPAWQAVMGMTVDVWGPNLLRGLLREQMKADGFRLRKAVADHFRGLAGAPDPLQSLGVLRDKLIAASGLDPQAAERLAKDLEAEYTAQVNKERARLAERLAKTRELAKAKAAEREAKRPQLDAESLIDAYERRQTEWLKPTGRKSAVRAIVRQALREGASVAGLNEQVVRGGVQAQLEAVGVPHEAAYRLAYEVWQERQAKGGGIEAVVAARVKELQLDLGRIIRQHWTQVDKAGESLAEHIVGETKMPAEQAERLAAAIQRRFKALVQARKEQALRNLAKTPAARELQKPSVAQRIIEATNLGALDSEDLWQAVADKLGLPTYTAEASAEVKRLADRAQQLPEGSVQRQEATARLMRFIARQKGVNLGDLGWAFWYANTLSGPITHAVNAFSNVLSLAGNVSTQFRDVRGIPQILAATAKGFRTGLTEARAIVKQGPGANRTKFTEQGQALENLDPQDFTGAGLVSQWRYVARALAASDAAFYFPAREAKAITLARALARQEGKTGAAIRTRAQQILDGTEEQQNLWGAQVDRERAQLVAMGKKPDALWTTRRLEQLREQGWGADIGEAADDFALRTTYNNRPYGLIGTLADVAKFAQNRVPGARGVVPFVNVVANVVNDSINYTPWGFARAYAAGRTGEPSVTLSLPFEWAERLREGKSPMTPDAVVDLHAKAALGTAMFGSLMAMALANLDDDDGENYQLYGSGPKDAAAKAALRETGWLPYSVRVNGTYLSFANTPLAIPLGALGHYLDAARYDKRFQQADAFNRLGVALWGGAHIITQQSFLDGLARLLGALEERRGRIDTASDRAVEQAFRSISSVAVPNALRQLDRLFDPTIYDTRGIEGALVAAIPFARRNGSPALNAFGEPITNEPWKRFASDAEANVWTDLARRKIYPSVADKAKNSNGREMTDDEHYRYVQESGQAIKRRLEQLNIRALSQTELEKEKEDIVREERAKVRRRLGF